MIEPMNDILSKAKEYRKLVARRAIAHEGSAEWHRSWGVRLGIAATAISALVGSVIFVTVTKQLGLEGPDRLSLPTGGWGWLIIYSVFGLFLISAPVLSGVNTFLNFPEQAEKHRASCAGYYRLQQRIDLFLLRYADVNSAATTREESLKELDDISKEIETVFDKSLTLTDRAYADAAAELRAGTTE